MQNTSPIAGMAVSRYSWDDWVKYAYNATIRLVSIHTKTTQT